MKREYGIYLLFFLFGTVVVNLLGNTTLLNGSILNRYSLTALSFEGIVYEEYFFQVLFRRFRTVIRLWLASKLIPKQFVKTGFAVMICFMLGGITAMAILENGLWGILFCLCAFLPHMICYAVAFLLWGSMRVLYVRDGNRKVDYMSMAFIALLIGIGCILEAYITPVFLRNIIK